MRFYSWPDGILILQDEVSTTDLAVFGCNYEVIEAGSYYDATIIAVTVSRIADVETEIDELNSKLDDLKLELQNLQKKDIE